MTRFEWQVITKSVIGDSHLKRGVPNQDAIGFYELPGNAAAKILAVSDGHGSEKCPRSSTGASFAVNCAITVFIEFWNTVHSKFEKEGASDQKSVLLSIERHIRKDLPKLIVKRWMEVVESHASSVPFSREYSKDEELLAYGATLTVVFICEYFCSCLRLGDCDALIVSQGNEVTRLAQNTGQHIGDETDSLCQRDSDKRFEVYFYGTCDDIAKNPKLILVCSDGYEKAFESDVGFKKGALDIADMLMKEDGKRSVEVSIEAWLREHSAFSGDDVSLGLLFDVTPSITQQPSILSTETLPSSTESL
jgi:serine/threonine protein phosphatase PrpC